MQLVQLREEHGLRIQHRHRGGTVLLDVRPRRRADHLAVQVEDQIVLLHRLEDGVQLLDVEDAVLRVCRDLTVGE